MEKIYDYIFELNNRQFDCIGVISRSNDRQALNRVWLYMKGEGMLRNQILIQKKIIGEGKNERSNS